MSDDNPHSRLSTEAIADFLADREGLAGGARERFQRLLHEYGGFREAPPSRNPGLLIFVSALLMFSGLILDLHSNWSDRLGWIGWGLISAGLIRQLRLEENRSRYSDRETDWEAYCLFLRPVILNDHPGLLDRNIKDSGNASAQSNFNLTPVFRTLIFERGPGFWWSAILGLWCGMIVLLVNQLATAAVHGILSLVCPAGGLLLGVALRMLWRRLIYVLAKPDSRVTGP